MTDTVRPRCVDTSGRAVLATDYMWEWWLAFCDDLGWTPTIVQGAYMSQVPGGGAADSAGYHDLGGCFDLRTWDLTPVQSATLVRALRRWGAAAWRRDHDHGGFDPHLHFVLGTDLPLAPGAAAQWRDYIDGGDGIGGRDYEHRPNPLVLTPPEETVKPEDIEAIAKRAAELVWAQPIGKDKTPAAKVLGAVKTWLARQS